MRCLPFPPPHQLSQVTQLYRCADQRTTDSERLPGSALRGARCQLRERFKLADPVLGTALVLHNAHDPLNLFPRNFHFYQQLPFTSSQSLLSHLHRLLRSKFTSWSSLTRPQTSFLRHHCGVRLRLSYRAHAGARLPVLPYTYLMLCPGHKANHRRPLCPAIRFGHCTHGPICAITFPSLATQSEEGPALATQLDEAVADSSQI